MVDFNFVRKCIAALFVACLTGRTGGQDIVPVDTALVLRLVETMEASPAQRVSIARSYIAHLESVAAMWRDGGVFDFWTRDDARFENPKRWAATARRTVESLKQSDEQLFAAMRAISSDEQVPIVDEAARLWIRRRAMCSLHVMLPWDALPDPAELMFCALLGDAEWDIELALGDDGLQATLKWGAAVDAAIDMVEESLERRGSPPAMARSSSRAPPAELRFRSRINEVIRHRNAWYERLIASAPAEVQPILVNAAVRQYVDGAQQFQRRLGPREVAITDVEAQRVAAARIATMSSPVAIVRQIGDIIEQAALESEWMHSMAEYQNIEWLKERLGQLIEPANDEGEDGGLRWRHGEARMDLRTVRIPRDQHMYDVPERLALILASEYGDLLRLFPEFATFQRGYEDAAGRYREFLAAKDIPRPQLPIAGLKPPPPEELAAFYTECIEHYDVYAQAARGQLDGLIQSATLAMAAAPDGNAVGQIIAAMDALVAFMLPMETSRFDFSSSIQLHEWSLDWSEVITDSGLHLDDESVQPFIERWPETVRARAAVVWADADYGLRLNRQSSMQALQAGRLPSPEYRDAIADRNTSKAALSERLRAGAALNHALYVALLEGLGEADRIALRSAYTRQRIVINDRSVQTERGHIVTALADAEMPVAMSAFETELELIEMMVKYLDHLHDPAIKTIATSKGQAACLTWCLSELRAIVSIAEATTGH